MKVKAKGGWVIVVRRPHPVEVRSRGGVIIATSSHDEEFFEATVDSIGDELAEDAKIREGDYVLVRNHSAKILLGTTKAGKVYALDYDDIICSYEDDED